MNTNAAALPPLDPDACPAADADTERMARMRLAVASSDPGAPLVRITKNNEAEGGAAD